LTALVINPENKMMHMTGTASGLQISSIPVVPRHLSLVPYWFMFSVRSLLLNFGFSSTSFLFLSYSRFGRTTKETDGQY